VNFFKYIFLLLCCLGSFVANAVPTHPIGSLSHEYSGHVNSLSIGGTLRANKDPIPFVWLSPLACNVVPSSSANLAQAMRNPGDLLNLGIPAGSTILAAHLYWAGSYDPNPVIPPYTAPIGNAPSNSALPDYNVLLNGVPITSTKNMTDLFTHTFPAPSYNYQYFGGYADVTAQVAAAGNIVYTFSGLTVNTRGYQCLVYGTLAGWALHVIYENPAEPFRVIKLYDGLQVYRGANILIAPSGFTTPAVPTGKLVITTWEGDEANSTPSALFSENLKINVLPNPVPTFVLSGPLNPLLDPTSGTPNQFNGTRNTTNPTLPLVLSGIPATYGVDVDHYDITAQLAPTQTSLTTEYSSGSDMVLLSSEMIVIENDLFADLAITKTHVGNFGVGIPNHYTISVSNVGTGTLLDDPGPITVTDTLPAGLNYVSASGTGWICSYAGTLSCSHPGPLVKGATLPSITLTVTAPAIGTVTNTATVSGSLVDNITLNNTSSDITNIINPPILTVLKSASAPNANPGANITYTVQVTNTGTGAATAVSQDDNLSKYTAFGVECMAPGVSIAYAEGVPASTLVKGTPLFSNNNGATFAYTPPSLGSGVCTYDPAITHFRLPMTGTMPPLGTYSLQYKVQVK